MAIFWGPKCCCGRPAEETVGCDDGCDMLILNPNLIADAYVQTISNSSGSISGNIAEWTIGTDAAEGVHIVRNDETYDNPSCSDILICIDREWTIIPQTNNYFICPTIYQNGEHFAQRASDGNLAYGCRAGFPAGMTPCAMTVPLTSSNFRKITYTSTTISFSTGNPDLSQPFEIGFLFKAGGDFISGSPSLEIGSLCVVCE